MDIEDYHAGDYEDRYEYKAFVPTPICREWVMSDPQLTTLLGEADRALGVEKAYA